MKGMPEGLSVPRPFVTQNPRMLALLDHIARIDAALDGHFTLSR